MFSRLPKSVITAYSDENAEFFIVFTDQYDPTQEISFYRPFFHILRRKNRGLIIISHSDLERVFAGLPPSLRLRKLRELFFGIKVCNIVLSRYSGAYWPEIMSLVRLLSVPSTVFLDDNLLEVPEDIGGNAAQLYGERERRNALLGTMEGCDCVVASTAALAKQLRKYPSKRITSLPIYCSVLDGETNKPKHFNTRIKIGYMASKWHRHDLDYIAPAVEEVLTTHLNVTFEVFGFEWDHPLMRSFSSRVATHLPVKGSYMSFRNRLSLMHWDIGLAPLRPIPYNRCKANTKWVEYTCAGIAVVAAKYDPYEQLPETATMLVEPENVGAWASALHHLIDDAGHRAALLVGGQNHLRSNYSIDAHADQVVNKFINLG